MRSLFQTILPFLGIYTIVFSPVTTADDIQTLYKSACAGCHDAGVLGAPKPGDSDEWGKRKAQSVDTIIDHAINGFNQMPPKGGHADLTDEQVKKLVLYMMDSEAMPAVAQPPAPSRTQELVDLLKGDEQYHTPPGDDQIPGDKYGDDVKLGKKIFTQTPRYAGRYSGNGLSCSNCHLDAGRRPHSAPLWAAYGMYPAYRKKNDRSNSLEERIQQCFRFSMNGFAPAIDAPEVRALVSYSHFLAKGAPIGIDMPGRGYPQIVSTGYDPNPTRGADAYKVKCASCHGADGGGQKDDKGNYTFPPLWGGDSYNKGAGLATNSILAGFIKANMPIGQEWSLTDQEALDIATYVNLQLRPWDPRKGFIKGIFD